MTNASNKKRIDKSPDDLKEADIANDKMGNNQLQGDDQEDVRNQRHAVPDAKLDPDDVIESFEKMDPHVRAERGSKKK